MGLANKVKEHIIVVVAIAFATGASLAWAVSSEVIVAPKQTTIDDLRLELANLRSDRELSAAAETPRLASTSDDTPFYLLVGTGSGGAWLAIEDIEGDNDRIKLSSRSNSLNDTKVLRIPNQLVDSARRGIITIRASKADTAKNPLSFRVVKVSGPQVSVLCSDEWDSSRALPANKLTVDISCPVN